MESLGGPPEQNSIVPRTKKQKQTKTEKEKKWEKKEKPCKSISPEYVWELYAFIYNTVQNKPLVIIYHTAILV